MALLPWALVTLSLSTLVPSASAQFIQGFSPPPSLQQQFRTDFPISEATHSIVKNLIPDFIKEIASKPDHEREALLHHYLRAVSSSRCKEDILAGFAILALTLSTPLTTPTWLLQMMDSWGKLPSGILSGYTQSSGDFHECVQLRGYYTSLPSLKINDFKGSYCSVNLLPWSFVIPPPSNQSDIQLEVKGQQLAPRRAAESIGEFLQLMFRFDVPMIPFLGTCLPSTCSLEDQQALLASAFATLTQETLYPAVIDCQTDEKDPLTVGAQWMIGILAVIGILCGLGTAYDLTVIRLRDPEHKGKGTATGEKYLLAFSLYENSQKILSTEAGSRTLSCLNGLRFLSISWVILGHTFVMASFQHNANNMDMKFLYQLGWPMMAIMNGTVAVDTFFVISGLLVAYNTLRELDKTKGIKEFAFFKVPMMYIQRYFRLTPTYIILIGCLATLFPYFSASPQWFAVTSESEICSRLWWQNALYINSITVTDTNPEICYGESWYLSNDMLFFLASPLIIIPLWFSHWIGLSLLALLSAGTLAINYYLITHYKINFTQLIHTMETHGYTNYNLIYIKPWARVGPYLIGIFVGWLLYKAPKPKDLQPSKLVTALGWAACTATALGVIFGPYDLFKPENLSAAQTDHSFGALLYGTTNRFLWGLCIAWIIYACVKGQGGIVNRMLSYEAFTPLARVTYCMYIGSFHWQLLYHFTQQHPVRSTPYTLTHMFFAHLVFNVLIGFGFTVTIESPFVHLTKLIFGRG